MTFCYSPERELQQQMSVSVQRYSTAVIGGLLSSSCCLIQLVLNVFSVGCAGFSVLSPYRALFLGLTATSLGASHLRHRSVRQSVTALAIALALSGMPEMISLYNESRPFSGRLLRQQGKKPLHAVQPQVIKMQVEGLRCAACGMRLKKALLQSPGVTGCEVEFEIGRTRIAGKELAEQSIRDTVERIGYSVRQIAFVDEPPGGKALWMEL